MNESARTSTYDALAYLCTQTLNVTLNVTLEKVPLEKVPLSRLSNRDGRYRLLAAPNHFESQFFKILQRTFTLGI